MKTPYGARYQILRPHDKGGIGEVTVRVWEASVPKDIWRQRGLVIQVNSLFEELGLREEVLAALRKDPLLRLYLL
jgi:hypothetical protein